MVILGVWVFLVSKIPLYVSCQLALWFVEVVLSHFFTGVPRPYENAHPPRTPPGPLA